MKIPLSYSLRYKSVLSYINNDLSKNRAVFSERLDTIQFGKLYSPAEVEEFVSVCRSIVSALMEKYRIELIVEKGDYKAENGEIILVNEAELNRIAEQKLNEEGYVCKSGLIALLGYTVNITDKGIIIYRDGNC